MVQGTARRRQPPILIAAALQLLACGDGDRLPPPDPLANERPSEDVVRAEPRDEEDEDAHAGEPARPAGSDAAPQPVGLQVTLPQDAGIDTITYTIERAGEVLTEAVIPIAGDSVIGVQIGNLPEGDGYTLHLFVEREAKPPCTGTTEFAIIDGRTTDITLPLSCPGLDAP